MNGMIDCTPYSTPYDMYEDDYGWDEENDEEFDEIAADDERIEKYLQGF